MDIRAIFGIDLPDQLARSTRCPQRDRKGTPASKMVLQHLNFDNLQWPPFRRYNALQVCTQFRCVENRPQNRNTRVDNWFNYIGQAFLDSHSTPSFRYPNPFIEHGFKFLLPPAHLVREVVFRKPEANRSLIEGKVGHGARMACVHIGLEK